MDWRRIGLWLLALVCAGLVALGVYAIAEEEVPCDHRARVPRREECP